MSLFSLPLTEEQIAEIAVNLEKILGEAVNGRTQVERLITLQACLLEGSNEAYDYIIDLLRKKSEVLQSKGQFDCEIEFLIAEFYVLKA